ncbi:serine/threonine-protein kinase [Stigmatella sp. ncwal1]|uniref:Serine/threonine-protein kinase n=1 Tax=Stigmatella ashevillensis TaxID=2995309 RepID=A0ABT5DJJ7_9BACT|nr:serine/threonine-protein kinase [Stigmatella ashevillena]MDC0713830.1 serine/threonine-protein kinase [Stigmatella ashevillena]
MDTARPELLPPGTLLGPWRLMHRAGRGAYGAVYRAVRVGQEAAGPVALKLSLYSREGRFEREAEVLSRVRHLGVPRLLDEGEWVGGPWRVAYPYLVMDWVEGQSLYRWARARSPNSSQILRLLAQLSRALQAVHEVHCLHRDVKGENVLVGPGGEAFLVDFGCGTYPEASPLTDTPLAPGTLPYRSPQALRHQWAHRNDGVHYKAGPEDDVYALGVTAYRLVTGMYPPPGTDLEARHGGRRGARPMRQPPHVLVPQVSPELSALIERMLAEAPAERGSARELADALEAAAASAGQEANLSLGSTEVLRPEPVMRPAPPNGWASVRAGLAGAALMGLLIWISTWRLPEGSWSAPAGVGQEDAGTVGVADASVSSESLATAVRSEDAEPPRDVLAWEMPKRPLAGQKRPPCKPHRETEIRGGCWGALLNAQPPCEDDGYEWSGKCFLPVAAKRRPDTSQYP